MRTNRAQSRKSAVVALVACTASFLAWGCSGTNTDDLREWTPDDHGQPQDPGMNGQAAPPEEGGLAATQEERALAALWQVSCATCHGMEGHGDGPGRPPGAQVRDLTDPEWQASVTDEEILQTISAGRGMMPRFDDRINARGLTLLVGYVRRLGGMEAGANAGGGGAEPAPEGPAPEGPAPEGAAPEGPAPEGPAPEGPAPTPTPTPARRTPTPAPTTPAPAPTAPAPAPAPAP